MMSIVIKVTLEFEGFTSTFNERFSFFHGMPSISKYTYKRNKLQINNLPLMREQMWQSHVCKVQQTEEFVANVHWLEANL
jgi:hypothetical protein